MKIVIRVDLHAHPNSNFKLRKYCPLKTFKHTMRKVGFQTRALIFNCNSNSFWNSNSKSEFEFQARKYVFKVALLSLPPKKNAAKRPSARRRQWQHKAAKGRAAALMGPTPWRAGEACPRLPSAWHCAASRMPKHGIAWRWRSTKAYGDGSCKNVHKMCVLSIYTQPIL